MKVVVVLISSDSSSRSLYSSSLVSLQAGVGGASKAETSAGESVCRVEDQETRRNVGGERRHQFKGVGFASIVSTFM